jgi:hypothetical protein
MTKSKYLIQIFLPVALIFVSLLFMSSVVKAQATQSQDGGVGLEGKISSPPPTSAPSISTPTNGQVFTTLPVTVRGVCSGDLLVKLFKNNVFSGSAVCQSGSYSIQIDLFSARNDLVARHYDALDQAGPDSNTVGVIFNDSTSRIDIAARVSMTSNYARKGANPNQLLSWPIIISGGTPPYAVVVDWGDGTTNDLYTITVPGEFSVKHKFDSSGSYRALIKASDKNGSLSFLQLNAIANGESKDGNVAGASADKTIVAGKTKILWQPVAIAIPLVLITFWLGKKYEIIRVKRKLERGEHPFQ